MPTQNVNLSEQQAKFIRQGIDAGRFRNASEVVRAGLRLLEQQERAEKLKLRVLRRLAKEAFTSIEEGDYIELGPDDDLDAFIDDLDVKSRPARSR